jgi:hypothetical protein
MEEDFHLVSIPALKVVSDGNCPPVPIEPDRSAMDHEVVQPRVALLFGFDEYYIAVLFETQQAGIGFASPQKPPAHHGLILTIDARGIVRGQVRVAKSAKIHHQLAATVIFIHDGQTTLAEKLAPRSLALALSQGGVGESRR